MIRFILVGVWVCAVTAASCYGTILWQIARASAAKEEPRSASLTSIKTGAISVPIIAGGTIRGYVMAKFVFNVEQQTLSSLSLRPDAFLIDEAFKTVYGAEITRGQSLQKPDLSTLGRAIKENANKRFGLSLVNEVLIQEFDYIAKETTQSQSPKVR